MVITDLFLLLSVVASVPPLLAWLVRYPGMVLWVTHRIEDMLR